MRASVAFMFCLIYSCTSFAGSLNLTTVVDLGYAEYEGVTTTQGVTQFLGMRYAAPPLGDLRFRAPRDPLQEKQRQKALSHGPICLSVQQPFLPIQVPAEDCLFIDVQAPAHASNSSKLPVMVWFQGGAFITNFNANYNATGLIHASNDGVVVVTFNFRVGLFGFLASEDIRRDGELNAGLLDQRKAISWVQEHISAFGGDPEKVTLFGTSVGSTLLQTLAYGGEGPPLFSAVIAEDPYVPEVLSVPDLEFQYQQILNATNCTSLSCLRGLSGVELEAVNLNRAFPGQSEPPLFAFGPCVDDSFLPDLPSRLIAEGRFHPVPLLQGTSTNEGTIFTPNVNNTVQFDDFFTTQFPNLETRDINAQYSYIPLGAEGTGTTSPYFERLAFAYGDSSFSCFGLSFAEAFSKAGLPVYSYRYNVLDPTLVGLGLGSPHTFEVEAVWGPGNAVNSAFSSVFKTSPDSYSNVNVNIVPVVQAYWTSFAVTHNPNIFKASGSPQWTTWAHGSRLKIQTNYTVMEEVDSQQFENCKFWASKAAQLHH